MKKFMVLAMGMVVLGGYSRAEEAQVKIEDVDIDALVRELASKEERTLRDAKNLAAAAKEHLEGAQDLRSIAKKYPKDLNAMLYQLNEKYYSHDDYRYFGILGAHELKKEILEATRKADAADICAAMLEKEAARRTTEAQKMIAAFNQKFTK